MGTIVEVTEEYNDEWSKVKVEGATGYMMRKFLRETLNAVTITLDCDVALALYAALQSVVRE